MFSARYFKPPKESESESTVAIQLSVFLIIFAEASRATRNSQAKTLAPTAKSL